MGRKKIRRVTFTEGDCLYLGYGTYIKVEFDEKENEFQFNHYTSSHNLISINSLIEIPEKE